MFFPPNLCFFDKQLKGLFSVPILIETLSAIQRSSNVDLFESPLQALPTQIFGDWCGDLVICRGLAPVACKRLVS